MVAALKELVDDIEEVLSARAKGAIGGGLEECMGGLKGLDCRRRKRKVRHSRNIWVQHFKTFVTFHLFCVHARVHATESTRGSSDSFLLWEPQRLKAGFGGWCLHYSAISPTVVSLPFLALRPGYENSGP